jgi:hypothetical protein
MHFRQFDFIAASVSSLNVGSEIDRVIYIHTAVLPNIQSTCEYLYHVGDMISWSKGHKFVGLTQKDEFLRTNPITLAVFGDWGARKEGKLAKQ